MSVRGTRALMAEKVKHLQSSFKDCLENHQNHHFFSLLLRSAMVASLVAWLRGILSRIQFGLPRDRVRTSCAHETLVGCQERFLPLGCVVQRVK